MKLVVGFLPVIAVFIINLLSCFVSLLFHRMRILSTWRCQPARPATAGYVIMYNVSSQHQNNSLQSFRAGQRRSGLPGNEKHGPFRTAACSTTAA